LTDQRFHFVSLGCAKNTVDSESMAALLRRQGMQAESSPEAADYLIVNTCGFIGPAKEESFAVLRELAENKNSDQMLIATGCLTQRYGSEVLKQVPGVDGILGTRRWMDIVTLIDRLRDQQHPQPIYHLPEVATVGTDESNVPRTAVHGSSAYLKIADGCRRPCAFCAIPLIKGTAVSRPVESILREARQLQEAGIREIILIAQDTTDYGHDLGIKDGLAALLTRFVDAVPDIDWIRILYAFPGSVSDRLIEVMASNPQVIPYLDMPLQHGHTDTLRRMRRPANLEWVHKTIGKMRSAMPELALRSTFIVGYPGETEQEFAQLLQFVEELRFDRLGVFAFSFEPGTSSEELGDPVPTEVKSERKDRLLDLQHGITLEKHQALIGQDLDVLMEGAGDGLSVGRSYRDAPEIDGLVIVEGDHPIGDMLPVRVTGAMPYDLAGEIAQTP
jgi:ribosomal protein S12 methylthiotransferase